MSTKQSKLTSQGQVSVPAAVRQFLSLSPGATMLWVQEGERMWVQRAVTHTTADVHQALFGKSAPPKTAGMPDTVSVLGAAYQRSPAQLAAALELLLSHESLVLQDADVVLAALTHFKAKPALGFSDCMVLEIARKAGHTPLGSFDKSLAKVSGVNKL